MADPVDVIIVGQALNDLGLEAFDTISGLGLNTFGFLWGCNEIWAPADAPVSTTWVNANESGSVEVCTD